MSNTEKLLYNKSFSHIYIEEKAYEYETTRKIIEKFKKAEKITIKHYKDIFSRGRQSFLRQKESQAIILAVKNEKMIYDGAKVCQDFGNEYFYYTSNIMNCIFDCEYCYLQGMYNSGNIVIFVNIEDTFKEIKKILKEHSLYLCISYDTDLLGMEKITGFIEKWCDFARDKENLKIEIRTKSADIKAIENIKALDNIIFAWTLSPNEIIEKYEHRTPKLESRIEAMKDAREMGWRIRACFDPMIYNSNFEKEYGEMFDKVFKKFDDSDIDGISLGVFRISQDYMKNMRKQRISAVTMFPYKIENGIYNYGKEKNEEMIKFAVSKIEKNVDKDKIFIWSDDR